MINSWVLVEKFCLLALFQSVSLAGKKLVYKLGFSLLLTFNLVLQTEICILVFNSCNLVSAYVITYQSWDIILVAKQALKHFDDYILLSTNPESYIKNTKSYCILDYFFKVINI